MTVRIEIAPSARKAVAIVISVESSPLGAIAKHRATFVMQQKIGRAIARIEIRSGIVILVEAEIVAVQAEIDVEPPVIVVVGDRCVCEGASRSGRELEGITLQRKVSLAIVQEEKRT